eukprot:361667-Chlamydomonas_euryale.AAC.1
MLRQDWQLAAVGGAHALEAGLAAGSGWWGASSEAGLAVGSGWWGACSEAGLAVGSCRWGACFEAGLAASSSWWGACSEAELAVGSGWWGACSEAGLAVGSGWWGACMHARTCMHATQHCSNTKTHMQPGIQGIGGWRGCREVHAHRDADTYLHNLRDAQAVA